MRRMQTPQTSSNIDTRHFLGVRQSFWQASLTGGRGFGKIQLQAIALWRRAANGKDSWSLQPLLDWPVRIGGRRIALRLTGDFGPDRKAMRIEFGVPAGNQNIAARTGLQVQQEQARTHATPLYEAEIAEQWHLASEIDLQGNLQWQQEERRSVTGSASLLTGKGAGSLTLQSDLDSGRQSYFGNAQGGFAWTRQGFDFAPAIPGEAAVVYVNNSPPDHGAADALLSNARIGMVQPQRSRVQPVSAFRRSAVGILPSQGASLSGSSPSRETTLFPGTVSIVAASFIHVTAIFGQLIDMAGAPIVQASLRGPHGEGAADADGYFQIDVAKAEQISVRRADGTTCEINLTPPEQDIAVYDAGQVRCK
jgi:outer membrane usher protein FimD/PapC